jgi:hypothetical protein
MSEHKNIYMALTAAQSGMGKVTKGSVNPAFKSRYADLADVVSVVVPALSEQGIAMYHSMTRDDHGMVMRTTLSHGATDTHIHCDVPLIVDRNNMQGMKSATTYAKRIGLESLTGIAPDTDDDGNAAAKAAPKPMDVKPPMGWIETIISELPDNATERDKARVVTDALMAQFKRKKTAGELSNEWDRRAAIIQNFESRFPEMHGEIVDAYENRMIEITPAS